MGPVVTKTTLCYAGIPEAEEVREWGSGLEALHPSPSLSTSNIPTGTDALASSHTWSAGTCLEVFPLGQTRLQASAQAWSWVFWSAVDFGSLSAVGMDSGSGSGEVTDVICGLTLETQFSSTSPTIKENPSIHIRQSWCNRLASSRNSPVEWPAESHHPVRFWIPPWAWYHYRWRGGWRRQLHLIFQIPPILKNKNHSFFGLVKIPHQDNIYGLYIHFHSWVCYSVMLDEVDRWNEVNQNNYNVY